MLEEFPVAGAQVVQSGFAVGSICKAVFRAFTVAGKQPFALPALGGERLLFHLSEGLLTFAVHHFHQCFLIDVSQLVFRKYKVVAGIYITVEFHYTGMSAGFCHGAYARLFAHPVGKGGVEELDIVSTYILFHPFIEQGAEEVSPLFRADGEVRQFRSLFLIGQ